MTAYIDLSDKQINILIEEHIQNMVSPEQLNKLLRTVVKAAVNWECYTDDIDWGFVQKKAAAAIKERDQNTSQEIGAHHPKKLKKLALVERYL